MKIKLTFEIDLSKKLPDAYAVVQNNGIHDVFVCRPVKAFLTKSVAELHAKAWNEGRNPTHKELAEIL